jgi:putative IMPACT (imprinted ancient) family translation regulator
LINAYRSAASDCIERARIVERVIEDTLLLKFDYEKLNLVMRIIKEENIHILKQECAMEYTFKINVRKSKLEQVVTRLKKIDLLKYELINL